MRVIPWHLCRILLIKSNSSLCPYPKVLVTWLCPILCDLRDCSLPGSSVHGILHARILEWVAIPFSRGSSQIKDRTCVTCITSGFFTIWATREAYIQGRWLYKAMNTRHQGSTEGRHRVYPPQRLIQIEMQIKEPRQTRPKMRTTDKKDLICSMENKSNKPSWIVTF